MVCSSGLFVFLRGCAVVLQFIAIHLCNQYSSHPLIWTSHPRVLYYSTRHFRKPMFCVWQNTQTHNGRSVQPHNICAVQHESSVFSTNEYNMCS